MLDRDRDREGVEQSFEFPALVRRARRARSRCSVAARTTSGGRTSTQRASRRASPLSDGEWGSRGRHIVVAAARDGWRRVARRDRKGIEVDVLPSRPAAAPALQRWRASTGDSAPRAVRRRSRARARSGRAPAGWSRCSATSSSTARTPTAWAAPTRCTCARAIATATTSWRSPITSRSSASARDRASGSTCSASPIATTHPARSRRCSPTSGPARCIRAPVTSASTIRAAACPSCRATTCPRAARWSRACARSVASRRRTTSAGPGADEPRATTTSASRSGRSVSCHGCYEHAEHPLGQRGELRDQMADVMLKRGHRFGFTGSSDSHGLLWHHGEARKRDPYRTGLTARAGAHGPRATTSWRRCARAAATRPAAPRSCST